MAEMNPDPTSTTEKIVPQMHDAYYKARKLYILFSTFLFSNELVGFTIKEVSVFGTKVDISPKHPKALVVGFFLVWIYSAVHFGIEWRQGDWDRRKFVASQWDFWLTHSIAIIAGTVWLSQRITGDQVAKKPLEFLLPFFVGLIVPFIFNFRERSNQDQINEKRRKLYKFTFIALCITAPVLTVAYLILFIDNISFIAILSLTGAFIIGMLKNALDGITPF